MSCDSTAEHAVAAGRSTAVTRERGADPLAVPPRSAAAGASEDPYRWRGLGVARHVAPEQVAPESARRTCAAEDRSPWRGLRPLTVAGTVRPRAGTIPPSAVAAETRPGRAPATVARAGPRTARASAAGTRQDEGRVIVIGLGNPILGDDGVGWRVADLVESRLSHDAGGVRVERAALGGLALMERLVGARRAILVDAMETGSVPAGTVRCMTLEEVGCRPAEHLDSVHDAPLTVAIAAGRALGADLPWDVSVVAVEARHVDTFSDDLTPAVEAAVPAAADAVLRLLRT